MDNKELVDYFISETNKRFDKIEMKLDELMEYKWTTNGKLAVLSAVSGAAGGAIMTIAAQVFMKFVLA